jgi:D-alanine-D-alanine ligase-like ATP-grasp enzyme
MHNKQKKNENIAIIMGGYSKQYEISLLSGSVVYKSWIKQNTTVSNSYFKRKMDLCR